jgi:hypothetical protein
MQIQVKITEEDIFTIEVNSNDIIHEKKGIKPED